MVVQWRRMGMSRPLESNVHFSSRIQCRPKNTREKCIQESSFAFIFLTSDKHVRLEAHHCRDRTQNETVSRERTRKRECKGYAVRMSGQNKRRLSVFKPFLPMLVDQHPIFSGTWKRLNHPMMNGKPGVSKNIDICQLESQDLNQNSENFSVTTSHNRS